MVIWNELSHGSSILGENDVSDRSVTTNDSNYNKRGNQAYATADCLYPAVAAGVSSVARHYALNRRNFPGLYKPGTSQSF